MEATVKLEISDAEWEVMRIVWTLGESNSRQITEILADKMGWKSATVKTLLGRLVKKQALTTRKDGNAFIYTPLVAEQDAMDSATRALFGHLCQMKVGQTLADLIDDLTLSKANIADLQAQLAEKAKTAPETVACDCLPDGCDVMKQEA
ncbi:CopY/TcrY family copper transport repressor [Furfurilactobacillus rossiae]|nr:CopY/TcrY family copper transport repressor [Furfurilactobacillus rossiae]QFR66793.1 CopY/TcrY family copper transport repressor [Furfurilactobacillus rossiae]QLE62279.1 Negative transcriptional regulator-copper transport operon [Furfurilactobacillus rossiae]